MQIEEQTGGPEGPANRSAAEFGIDLERLDELLRLTPFHRLLRHDQALELVLAA